MDLRHLPTGPRDTREATLAAAWAQVDQKMKLQPPDKIEQIDRRDALGAFVLAVAGLRSGLFLPDEILQRVVATAGKSNLRTLPTLVDTPEILKTCGCESSGRGYTGVAAFGNAGQFAGSPEHLEWVIEAITDGFGLQDSERPSASLVGRILGRFLGRSVFKEWPVLAIATPVNVAMALGKADRRLHRTYDSFRHRPYYSADMKPKLEFGFKEHLLGFELPYVLSLRLLRPTVADKKAVVNRISYRTETRLGTGVLSAKVSEDFYDHIIFPLEPTPQGVRAFMPYTPTVILEECDTLTRNGVPIGTIHPSLDVWIIDPRKRPSTDVTGYLLKLCFHPNGQIYRIAASRREMRHILAEGSLTRETLARALIKHRAVACNG